MAHYKTRLINPPPRPGNTEVAPADPEGWWWFTPENTYPPDVDAWDIRHAPDDMPDATPVLVAGRWEWAAKEADPDTVPDFDAAAVAMIENASEGDGWIPPARADNLADRIAAALYRAHEQGQTDTGTLARMLADEQAAHEATKADAWQSLATQRQQETEAALAWARRWKTAAHSMRTTAQDNWQIAQQMAALAREPVTEHRARIAKIRELVDSMDCWLPPLYRAELMKLLEVAP